MPKNQAELSRRDTGGSPAEKQSTKRSSGLAPRRSQQSEAPDGRLDAASRTRFRTGTSDARDDDFPLPLLYPTLKYMYKIVLVLDLTRPKD